MAPVGTDTTQWFGEAVPYNLRVFAVININLRWLESGMAFLTGYHYSHVEMNLS